AERNVTTHNRRILQQPALFRCQTVDTCSNYRLDRRGHAQAANFAAQGIGARQALQRSALHQRLHGLLYEQWNAVSALSDQPHELAHAAIVAQDSAYYGFRLVTPQRFETDLAVVALGPPVPLKFGPECRQKQDRLSRDAVDQSLKYRLAVGVNPMQVL